MGNSSEYRVKWTTGRSFGMKWWARNINKTEAIPLCYVGPIVSVGSLGIKKIHASQANLLLCMFIYGVHIPVVNEMMVF